MMTLNKARQEEARAWQNLNAARAIRDTHATHVADLLVDELDTVWKRAYDTLAAWEHALVFEQQAATGTMTPKRDV